MVEHPLHDVARCVDACKDQIGEVDVHLVIIEHVHGDYLGEVACVNRMRRVVLYGHVAMERGDVSEAFTPLTLTGRGRGRRGQTREQEEGDP